MPKHQPNSAKKLGFTLIELSIVLVVIGLIIAGTLSTKALINGAKIRAQNSQLRKIEFAYNTFRATYDSRPGDLANASSYWSTATNGNGDGILNAASGVDYADGSYDGEMLHFFNHLSLAGMLQEFYTGGAAVPFTNVPPVLLENSFAVLPIPRFRTESNGCFGLTNCVPAANRVATFLYTRRPGLAAAIPASNMQALDTKMDDGLPATGRLLGFGYFSAICANTAVSPNTYLSTNSQDCCFMYRLP